MNIEKCRLKLYNSLTQSKVEFKPLFNNTVTWYCCGPTVYDSAHMGHARSYITFDIIRRVLSEYFNYSVIFVMNITDIDDKIISKARKEYLWSVFKEENVTEPQFNTIIEESIKIFKIKISKTTDQDLKDMYLKRLESLEAKISSDSLQKLSSDPFHLFNDYKDIISNYLDTTRGSNVTDHKIFNDISQKYEAEFMEDLNSLNILPPTFMPRVTEFIQPIIEFISNVIENGFAYPSNGSVYFDTSAFMKTHKYAKLMPSAAEDLNNLATGEGEFSVVVDAPEKRSPRDFALWKASKSGEPSWSSPWGLGRPGWHIECSAMCHAILPNRIDLHSGGVDLKFPHHDNEIAQSEAYYKSETWVNNFLHSGHLTIEGCKMSKSLKNFVTIKDALKTYSARQIRLAFLMHTWNGPLDFSTNVMSEACTLDKRLSDFVSRLNSFINDNSFTGNTYSQHENQLKDEFIKVNQEIHSALCDNIDTPKAMILIKSLISTTYTYIADKDNKNLHKYLLLSILRYILKILNIFGTEYDIGISQSDPDKNQLTFNLALESAKFRSRIRTMGMDSKNTELLQLCDEFRDVNLFNLGVKIEDRETSSNVIITTKEELEKEREEKTKILERKKQLIADSKQRQAEKSLERNNKSIVPPSEMFLSQTDKYSKFDEEGIPILCSEGKAISKSALKKLKKLQEKQKILYEKQLTEVSDSTEK